MTRVWVVSPPRSSRAVLRSAWRLRGVSPLPTAIVITNVGNHNNIFLRVSLGKSFGSSSFENILIVRVSKMAVRTIDGKQVLKIWNRRRLEEWGDDVR